MPVKWKKAGKTWIPSAVYPDAFGFHAQMPAGLARMAYWPDAAESGEGFVWVAEAQTKKGWSRMVEHHYRRMERSES